MCTRMDCVNNMGKWIQFQTPWGFHRGIVSDVNDRAVLVRVPRMYVPTGFATYTDIGDKNNEAGSDLALTQWGYRPGYGGPAYAGPGYTGPSYGGVGRWGYPGYGAWSGGWWLWWLAFAWIWALAFLW